MPQTIAVPDLQLRIAGTNRSPSFVAANPYRVSFVLSEECTVMQKRLNRIHRGFSLLELLAVVTILGIIAAIIVPRVTTSSTTAKTKVRDHHKATINAAVERYYIDNNAWPATNLSDIGGNVNYFPDGLPTNPIDGSAYSLNATTHRVN
jgi:general secretion pathway protein G